MRHWTIWAAALWLAATGAEARTLGPSDFLQPLLDISAKPLGPDEGAIVIGYAVRGARAGAYGEWPTHIGWMPFADDSLAWTGQPIALSSERCSRGSSAACTKIQYRVHRLPAGGYSLAWIFHDKAYAIAKFGSGTLSYDRNMREVVTAHMPDAAQSAAGAWAFRVLPGQANYVGNLLIQFRDGRSPRIGWVERHNAEVAAMMKEAGYETLLNFQGSRLGTGR